jgi:hypothetical protein
MNAQGTLVGIPIISEFIKFASLIKQPPKGATTAIKSIVLIIDSFVLFA